MLECFLSITDNDWNNECSCNARASRYHPLFLQILHIITSSDRSQILIKYALSPTPAKGDSDNTIAQMSSGYQQVGGNINSFNNNNSFNNIVNFNTELGDEGRQILRWLSPLKPQQRHQGVRTDRLDGVGNWVLETSKFRNWRDTDDGCAEQVLFCYGNPGVGKTYARWERLFSGGR